jgi:hypothetical protein
MMIIIWPCTSALHLPAETLFWQAAEESFLERRLTGALPARGAGVKAGQIWNVERTTATGMASAARFMGGFVPASLKGLWLAGCFGRRNPVLIEPPN